MGMGVGGLLYLVLAYSGVRKEIEPQEALLKAEGFS
jgi:hypothetical protein